MSEHHRLPPGITAKVIENLQRHPSRDKVELVVDLGLDWGAVEPSLNALVEDGVVSMRVTDGERVYELARSAVRNASANALFG